MSTVHVRPTAASSSAGGRRRAHEEPRPRGLHRHRRRQHGGLRLLPLARRRWRRTAILAILSWVVMGVGAICLGLTFARLARLSPATGGPYAYTRMGFGDFAGFLVAWGYWISIWASLPAIAVAFTGSLFKICPGPARQPADGGHHHARCDVARRVHQPARRERGGHVRGGHDLLEARAVRRDFHHRTVLHRRVGILSEFNPSGQSLLASSAALAPLTMFAYLGLESATVPAGDVKDPARTIPRSTIIGIVDRRAALRAGHDRRPRRGAA